MFASADEINSPPEDAPVAVGGRFSRSVQSLDQNRAPVRMRSGYLVGKVRRRNGIQDRLYRLQLNPAKM